MKSRAGFTLVETLLVVTLAGLLLALTATLFGAAMRTTRRLLEQRETNLSLSRLAERIRSDAHEATTAKVLATDESSRADLVIELQHGDKRTVRYYRGENGLERELREGGEVRHHDSFRLPEGTEMLLSVRAVGEGQLLSIELSPGLPMADMTRDRAVARIGAAVGLHRRLESADGEDRP